MLTGFGGQLGREWVDHFTQTGLEFNAFGSADLDITDEKAVDKVIADIKPDVIINCAAYTKVDLAEDESERCAEVNTLAVGYLASSAAKHGAKFVHYSTDYVFSGVIEDRITFPKGYPPNHGGNPQNVYGRTKWEGEEFIRNTCEDYLILRVSWLCGKHGNNFVKTMRRLASERPEINVVSDQFGSPSFTDQVVFNTIKLIDKQASGTFHIASDGLISWYDFAKEIIRLSDVNCKVNSISSNEFPQKATRPAYSKLDCSETEQLTGVKIENWKTALQRLIYKLV
jgi:dTDP-4-dehydrorhamnose reductase